MLREFANRSIAKEVERARVVRVGGCSNTRAPFRGSHSKVHSVRPSPFPFTLPRFQEKEQEAIYLRRGKKPTRKQKIRLGQAGLAPENWLIVKQKQNGELVILHKHTDTIRVVPPLAG